MVTNLCKDNIIFHQTLVQTIKIIKNDNLKVYYKKELLNLHREEFYYIYYIPPKCGGAQQNHWESFVTRCSC